MAHAWDLIIIHLQEGWLSGGRQTLKTLHIGHKWETEINLDKIQGCIKGDRQTKMISAAKGYVKIKGKTVEDSPKRHNTNFVIKSTEKPYNHVR